MTPRNARSLTITGWNQSSGTASFDTDPITDVMFHRLMPGEGKLPIIEPMRVLQSAHHGDIHA